MKRLATSDPTQDANGHGDDVCTESIGARITRLRIHKGLSQSDLAKILQVSNVAIWNWEGDKARPKLQRQRELASTLGVSVPELLGIEVSGALRDVVSRCRIEIAETAGISPEQVRISLDI